MSIHSGKNRTWLSTLTQKNGFPSKINKRHVSCSHSLRSTCITCGNYILGETKSPLQYSVVKISYINFVSMQCLCVKHQIKIKVIPCIRLWFHPPKGGGEIKFLRRVTNRVRQRGTFEKDCKVTYYPYSWDKLRM